MSKTDKSAAAKDQKLKLAQERLMGRIRGHRKDADWAFFHIADKLSDNQAMFCCKLAEDGGSCGSSGCGIDFGGWSAHNSLVAALRKKGVLQPGKDRGWQLVAGEPVPQEELQLEKPFQKVRRELLSLFDGESIATVNAQVWLDPRGETTFHVLLHETVGEHFPDDSRICRVGGGLRASRGSTFKEAIDRAQALCFEYFEFNNATFEDVILIKYDAKADTVIRDQWSQTGLLFAFHQLVLVSGKKLYRRTASGGLEPNRGLSSLAGTLGSDKCKEHLLEERSALILFTPERLSALESLRLRLATMAREFAAIIHAEDFAQLLEGGGHQLLENKGESRTENPAG